MSESYRRFMRELTMESAQAAPKDAEQKFDNEPGLKPQGEVQIVLPWDSLANPGIDELEAMLESRGWAVSHGVRDAPSMEGQDGDGTMVGTKGYNGGNGPDRAIHDSDTDGIANDVVNGIYIKTVQAPVQVTVIRPEDVVPVVDASDILYLKDANEEEAEEIQTYLSQEGRTVVTTPQALCDELQRRYR